MILIPAQRRASVRTMELKLKYLTLSTLLFSISISGCAITISELKSGQSSYDGSFTSKTKPSDTYRTLRHMARQCLEYEAYSGNPVIVLSEFDGERNEGEINQKLLAQGLLINNTLIEIERNDGDKAQVSLYTTKNILSVGIRSPNISDIKRWADGDRAC
ncbi:hypothetical protein ALQ63_01438 [Serratia plymuthica]|nr:MULTISPECIES: hypothetical protein [Enterobacterales]NWA71988.1 hypothetical protein [Serratia proteamaculans]AGP47334.1 hypothetical protein M621_21670 [Serratia plymuthica S13]ANK00398.1 hypothetical protein ADP73_21540 [Serratia plymuthica]KYG16094.1 hypothetical protein SOD10_27970 [Serratia plymuthica]MBI6137934.1 hypothetical protein [Serratia plymuthica]